MSGVGRSWFYDRCDHVRVEINASLLDNRPIRSPTALYPFSYMRHTLAETSSIRGFSVPVLQK